MSDTVMMEDQLMLETWMDGGRVSRFHQWEMVKRQTVAEHTFNMLLIAEWAYGNQLDPIRELQLFKAILFHDVAEGRRGLSDVSSWSKRNNLGLAQAVAIAEVEIEEWMNIDVYVDVPPDLRGMVKFCDIIELMVTIVRERRLGNTILFESAWPDILQYFGKTGFLKAHNTPNEIAIWDWIRGQGFKYE